MDTDAWNSANAVQRNVSMMAPRYSTPPTMTMPAQQAPTNRGNGLLPLLFKYYFYECTENRIRFKLKKNMQMIFDVL